MSQVFQVKQADMLSQVYLGKPFFGMFRDVPALLDQLFGRLEHYKPMPADARLESANDHFGQVHLSLGLLTGVAVRVHMDRIEVQSSLPTSWQVHDETTIDVLEALARYLPETSWKAFTATLSLHGNLPCTSGAEFLSRFASPNVPQSPGPLLGTGTVFYYGAEGRRLASSVTLDFSAVAPEGVLLKLRLIQDASGLAARDLPQTFRDQSDELFAEMGITLES